MHTVIMGAGENFNVQINELRSLLKEFETTITSRGARQLPQDGFARGLANAATRLARY